MKSLESTGSGKKESANKITAFVNHKAHYLYGKYGKIYKNSIFSHFVFGKIRGRQSGGPTVQSLLTASPAFISLSCTHYRYEGSTKTGVVGY
jgi:hypothetical protein